VPRAERPIQVGVDLVEVARVSRLLEENPGIDRTIFTDQELGYCRSSKRADERLAARFAAKEAILKALGTGMAEGLSLCDVEIVGSAGGAPTVRLLGPARAWADDHGVVEIEVSLAHSGGLAIAQAISFFRPA